MNALAILLFLLAAEPQAETFPQHLIRVDAGFASAVGFFGASYAIAPVRSLMLEAGAGIGVSGLQLSAMPKLVIGSERHRLIVGLGPSVAIPGLEPYRDAPRRIIVWFNLDVGYDYRSASGFSFAVAGGLTATPATIYYKFMDSRTIQNGVVCPQLRIGIGHWF